jgi:hypothetical protein
MGDDKHEARVRARRYVCTAACLWAKAEDTLKQNDRGNGAIVQTDQQGNAAISKENGES